jgi:hypothetical protein
MTAVWLESDLLAVEGRLKELSLEVLELVDFFVKR